MVIVKITDNKTTGVGTITNTSTIVNPDEGISTSINICN